jgi:hypothetical protein
LVGCENAAETGSVKYLSDDLKLECEGTEAGKARGCWPASACTSAPAPVLLLMAHACARIRLADLRVAQPVLVPVVHGRLSGVQWRPALV